MIKVVRRADMTRVRRVRVMVRKGMVRPGLRPAQTLTLLQTKLVIIVAERVTLPETADPSESGRLKTPLLLIAVPQMLTQPCQLPLPSQNLLQSPR